MERMSVKAWLQSMRGRTRWELQYEATAMSWPNGNILDAIVYDDYLIFQAINGQNLDEYKNLHQILITDLNECDLCRLADTLEEVMNTTYFEQ